MYNIGPIVDSIEDDLIAARERFEDEVRKINLAYPKDLVTDQVDRVLQLKSSLRQYENRLDFLRHTQYLANFMREGNEPEWKVYMYPMPGVEEEFPKRKYFGQVYSWEDDPDSIELNANNIFLRNVSESELQSFKESIWMRAPEITIIALVSED